MTIRRFCRLKATASSASLLAAAAKAVIRVCWSLTVFSLTFKARLRVRSLLDRPVRLLSRWSRSLLR